MHWKVRWDMVYCESYSKALLGTLNSKCIAAGMPPLTITKALLHFPLASLLHMLLNYMLDDSSDYDKSCIISSGKSDLLIKKVA